VNIFRLLFHIHTIYSWDGFIKIEELIAIAEKFNITHLCVTEHNNIDSYWVLCDFVRKKKSNINIIPGVEYTTKVGDIIIMGLAKIFNFDFFEEWERLVKEAQNNGGVVVLPHPYKRKNYPKELIERIDVFEAVNMRGICKKFTVEEFAGKPCIYGVDAHLRRELPGIINNVVTSYSDLLTALKKGSFVCIPEIYRKDLCLLSFCLKSLHKIKRIINRRKKR